MLGIGSATTRSIAITVALLRGITLARAETAPSTLATAPVARGPSTLLVIPVAR